MKLKKINLREVSSTLSEKEMKNVLGSSSSCTTSCQPGSCGPSMWCIQDPRNHRGTCHCSSNGY